MLTNANILALQVTYILSFIAAALSITFLYSIAAVSMK